MTLETRNTVGDALEEAGGAKVVACGHTWLHEHIRVQRLERRQKQRWHDRVRGAQALSGLQQLGQCRLQHMHELGIACLQARGRLTHSKASSR